MHCFPDTFVLYRQISFTSSTQRSHQRDQNRSLVSCRVWLLGAGVLGLLAVWLASVYRSHEFESRSRYKVCPCCLMALLWVPLYATSAWDCCKEEEEEQVAGALGNVTTRETLVLLV